jgi:hypothetical protein
MIFLEKAIASMSINLFCKGRLDSLTSAVNKALFPACEREFANLSVVINQKGPYA